MLVMQIPYSDIPVSEPKEENMIKQYELMAVFHKKLYITLIILSVNFSLKT